MKKIINILLSILIVIGCSCGILVTGFSSGVVFADDANAETNIIECGDENGVVCILKIVLNVMTFGIGVLAVIGIVLAGIQYITSQGDPGKMAKAKNRIIQVVIGLVIYAVMYAALYFLVPGFNTTIPGTT